MNPCTDFRNCCIKFSNEGNDGILEFVLFSCSCASNVVELFLQIDDLLLELLSLCCNSFFKTSSLFLDGIKLKILSFSVLSGKGISELSECFLSHESLVFKSLLILKPNPYSSYHCLQYRQPQLPNLYYVVYRTLPHFLRPSKPQATAVSSSVVTWISQYFVAILFFIIFNIIYICNSNIGGIFIHLCPPILPSYEAGIPSSLGPSYFFPGSVTNTIVFGLILILAGN